MTDVASLDTGHRTAEKEMRQTKNKRSGQQRELPHNLNDTGDWYYEGEEGHEHDVNYVEES